MIAYFLHVLFLTYTLMIFARVLGSWFPDFQNHIIMRFLSHYTDPYLNLFRRIIPPIGGFLDLSPLFGVLLLQIVEKFLIWLVL